MLFTPIPCVDLTNPETLTPLLSLSSCGSERDNGMMGRDRGRMSDMGPDKTDSADWRARPVNEDDGPPKRDDAFGERESRLLGFIHK